LRYKLHQQGGRYEAMGLTIRLLMMRATKAKRNFHKIDRAPSLTIRIRDEAVNHEDS